MLDTFDRVVCLNLDRRPDRWERFQARLATIAGGWPFAPVERFKAVDAKVCEPPAWWRADRGAWGCMQSHIRIIEAALLDGVESILVLEDDAMFCEGFRDSAAAFLSIVPAEWDSLMLGGQHLVKPDILLPADPSAGKPALLRVNNGNRTHGYALRRGFMSVAYRHLCDYADHLKHRTHHVDHRFGVLHRSGRHKVYAPSPWLIGQAESTSDISGKSLKDRFWDRR